MGIFVGTVAFAVGTFAGISSVSSASVLDPLTQFEHSVAIIWFYMSFIVGGVVMGVQMICDTMKAKIVHWEESIRKQIAKHVDEIDLGQFK